MAAVKAYNLEPERVLEENKVSNDDSDTSEAFVVNSEKL